MRRSLLNKRILPKPLRQALVLITLLLLPGAAWADITYGGNSLTFNYSGTSGPNFYYSGTSENQVREWNATSNGDYYQASTYTYSGFSYVKLTYVNPLSGPLTGFTLAGSINNNNPVQSNNNNVNLKVYKLATIDATEGTLIGTIAISGTDVPSYTYTAENGVSQSFNNEYIQLSLERISNDINPTFQTGQISSITLTFSGTDYGISVGNYRVTSNNASNVLGDATSSVSYHNDNKELTLNGATITGNIVKSSSADDKALIINLGESNILTGSIAFNSQLGDLTFTGDGSLAISSEEGVLSGIKEFNASGFYLATDHPLPFINEYGYYLCAVPDASGTDRSVKQLTVSKDLEVYPIWVHNETGTGYTQVTKDNKDNVLSNNHIAYNNETPTLTLSDYTLTTTGGSQSLYAFYIGKDLKNMTVNLVGNSTIGDNDNGGSGFAFEELSEQEEKASLTFTTSKTSPGSLTVGSELTDGSVTVNYSNGLGYTISTKKVSTDWTRLIIGETPITGNATTVEGYENVSFDDENNILTLSGATIGSSQTTGTDIFVYMKDLTVEISGTNTINGRFWGQYEKDRVKGTILFKKVSNAQGNPSLTISGNVGASGPIYEFSNCTWDKDLYLTGAKDAAGNDVLGPYYEDGSFHSSSNNAIKTIIFSTTKPSESIWIGATEVGADGKFTVEGVSIEGVSFDSENNILTLNNADLQSKGNIISSLPSLTIKLTGKDETHTGQSNLDRDSYIISTNPSATLTFTTDGNNSLYASTNKIPWKGFAGNPTFENKLFFKVNGDVMFIKVLQAPTMSYSSGELTFDGLSDGYINNAFDCYYTITYEDGDGSDPELYQYDPEDPVSMEERPCTVTAYVTYTDVFDNTTQSENAIGKYFGFAETMVLTTLASETEEKEIVLPALQPAIDENDFSIATESNIIYKNGDKWMIKGYGEAFLYAQITPSATTPYTVLNSSSSDVFVVVNVLHEPTFTAYYGDDETKVYDGNGSGNVSVKISSIDDLGSEYSLMYYLGTDNTTPTPYEEPISLNATTTVNAFIRYVNSDNSSITYDSEPVSMEYLVSQKLETPAFEGNINFQTCYLKDYSLAKPAGLKVYIITEISLTDNTLKAISIDYIPKYVPVLLEKEGETPEGGYVAATYTGEEGEFSNNKLYYTDYQIDDLTGTEYVLFNNEFVKATGIIAAGHCYLSLDGPHANTRGFSIDTSGNGTTGINSASLHDSREVMTNQWYDLQGRKIQKPTKAGLYIVNGKKVVIK